MRQSAFDAGLREFRIEAGRVRVVAMEESGIATMGGMAAQRAAGDAARPPQPTGVADGRRPLAGVIRVTGPSRHASGTAYRTTSQKQHALPARTKRCQSACEPNQCGNGSGLPNRKISAPIV